MGARVDRYWTQFLSSLPSGASRPSGCAGDYFFGSSPDHAHEITQLVLEGTKTATGSLLWSFEFDQEPVPRAGDYWVVTNGRDDPVCIVRTVQSRTIPFDEVEEEYAWAGGEGDRTLASWREIYSSHIASECARIGRAPAANAPLVMERFELVYSKPLES